jgi:hypothetical protein
LEPIEIEDKMAFDPVADKILQIFFPYMRSKQKEIESNKTRFVHYTSADAAMKILESKEVWMRESSCMNDFMEVQYGFERVLGAYDKGNECGQKFQAAINSIADGISTDIEKLFNGWWPHLERDTYFTCVSEHNDSEDITGRLSMWRAYSQSTGAAIVMHNEPFLSESDALKAYTTPVAYLSDEEFKNEFCKVADNITANIELIKTLPRENVISYIFEMLKFAAVATKHPGFKEEKEWRVVYFPNYEKSSHIIPRVKTFNSDPQPIYAIPLQNIPAEGLTGVEIPELIERIIIGPTEYPVAIRKAFITLLAQAGVQNPETKVWASNIPLRR